MSIDASDIGLQKCLNYLQTLTEECNKEKLNLSRFEDLLTSSTRPLNEHLVRLIFDKLLQLFRKCEDHFQLSCDISYALGCVLYSLADDDVGIFFDLLENRTSSIFERWKGHLAVHENYAVFLLAALTFLTNRRHQLESRGERDVLNRKVDEFTASALPSRNKINVLIAVCHQRLSLIERQRKISDNVLTDALISTVSVVLIHWNHHITDFRRRIRALFATCLRLNYAKNVKRVPGKNPLAIFVSMELFRAFAHDTFWSLPFKYYAYLVGLEFVESVDSATTFLMAVRGDLRRGFAISLRNRRVINVEAELFRYCADVLDENDWIAIFDPVVNDVLACDDFLTAANFARYWLPVIARKYPTYCQTMFDRIPTERKARTIAHSRILTALLKICHLGRVPLKAITELESFLPYLREISHDAEETRGDLFALLCNLNDQSVLPTADELELICSFLLVNVHSRCTLLRQQILSSFAGFVLRLVCSSVRTMKKHASDDAHVIDDEMQPVTTFLNKLNDFFVTSVAPGSSYQCKVTGLHLYKIFMSYAIRDCGIGRDFRRNNLKDAHQLVEYAKSRDSWRFATAPMCERLFRCVMDPCEEIQKLSFALLREYFDLETLGANADELLAVATRMLNDNQFYTRNSAVNAFLSGVTLAYNTGEGRVTAELRKLNAQHSNFVQMFTHRLTQQVAVLREDILKAALNHPIDASVKVLTYLMTDKRSPEFETVTADQIATVIQLLETAVPILLDALFVDKKSDYAPSFEESDNALQIIINNSPMADELKVTEPRDQFQLQPINQVLMNFIWITLKVCCEFESALVCNRAQTLDEQQLVRCGALIVEKLKLCRHKGVIEAAGIALSNIVDTLTACQMCERWLDSILMDVIRMIEHSRGATISRKSAGLSLLVQNVVANDRRPGKPLLTTCWNELRRILDAHHDAEQDADRSSKQETLHAHVLHFLRVLIADSRNSEDLWPHFEQITLKCLNLLNTRVWTIRNAALQLFGAIAPKMVGQKNSQNDFGVRRSFEEVFLSMPTLFDHVVSAFERSTSVEDAVASELQRHCDLIPLLILLKGVQVGSENTMNGSMRSKLQRLRSATVRLLGSESYSVRELACKTFISLYSASDAKTFLYLLQRLKPMEKWSTNSKHGYLTMLKEASSMYPAVRKACVGFFGERNDRGCVMTEIQTTSSMILSIVHDLELQVLSEKSLMTFLFCIDIAASTWSKLPKRYLFIGHEELSRVLMRKGFKHCNGDRDRCVVFLAACFNACSNPSMIENCVEALQTQPHLMECGSQYLIHHLIRSLKDYVSRGRNANDIFRILLVIAKQNTNVVECSDEDVRWDFLLDMNCCRYKALNLLVAAQHLTSNAHRMTLLERIEDALRAYPQLEDLRRNCALSMLAIGEHLKNLEPKYRTTAWSIVLNLVQDEENDIQLAGCECYRVMFGSSTNAMLPETVSVQMHDVDTMRQFLFSNDIVQLLWDTISATRFEMAKTDEIANPFDFGMVNFYREDVNVVRRATNSFLAVISSECVDDRMKYQISDYYVSSMADILRISRTTLESGLLTSVPAYVLSGRCYYLLTIYLQYGTKIISNDVISLHEVSRCCERLQTVFNFAAV